MRKAIEAAERCAAVPRGARHAVRVFPEDELDLYRARRDTLRLLMGIAADLSAALDSGEFGEQGAGAGAGAAAGGAPGDRELQAQQALDELRACGCWDGYSVREASGLFRVCRDFGLWEQALRVLAFSKLDSDRLSREAIVVWRQIRNRWVPRPSSPHACDANFAQLRAAVRRLGSEFGAGAGAGAGGGGVGDRVFPVDALCQLLEERAAQYAYTGEIGPAWVVDTLLGAGGEARRSLLLSQVYGAYHGLYRAAQTRPARQLRLLACLREVLARSQQHDELGFMRQVRALAPAAGPACARVVLCGGALACARVRVCLCADVC